VILRNKFILRAAMAVALCAATMSCSQTKVPAEISNRLQGLKGEIQMGRGSLRATTAALANLRDNKGSDLRPQFDAYVKALEALDSKAGGVGLVANMTSDQADKYFKNWDAQINTISDQHLRDTGEDRRQSSMDEYAKLRALDAELRVAFRPYMGTLVDIKTSLTADLTQQGLKNAQPTIKKAIDGEDAVLKHVDAIVKQIDAMSSN
jgi:hypothetical protein